MNLNPIIDVEKIGRGLDILAGSRHVEKSELEKKIGADYVRVMEEIGLISRKEKDNKHLYSITQPGESLYLLRKLRFGFF